MDQKEFKQSILSLWAIGVGSTIGGDFFGYQNVLKGGLLIALISTAVCSLIFLSVGYAVSQLTVRLHHCCKNGSVARVSLVLGKMWGIWSACFSLLKVHNVLCALMVGMSGYILSLLDLSEDYQFVLYPVLYLIFYAINCQGAEFSSMQQIVITIFCLIILAIYYSVVGTNLNFEAYALPYVKTGDVGSVIGAIPFGCWLFLGFEEIPLLVTSTKFTDDVAWRVSRSILYSYVTLTFFGFLTVILSAASSPGLEAVSDSNVPLLEGLKDAIRSNSLHPYYNGITSVMSVCFVLALACPTISFTMYTGKFIEQLAESKSRGGMGLLPSWLICDSDALLSGGRSSEGSSLVTEPLLRSDAAYSASISIPCPGGGEHAADYTFLYDTRSSDASAASSLPQSNSNPSASPSANGLQMPCCGSASSTNNSLKSECAERSFATTDSTSSDTCVNTNFHSNSDATNPIPNSINPNLSADKFNEHWPPMNRDMQVQSIDYVRRTNTNASFVSLDLRDTAGSEIIANTRDSYSKARIRSIDSGINTAAPVPFYCLRLACVVGTIQCCLFGLIFGINTSGRILISASLLPALLDYVIQLQCYHEVICAHRKENLISNVTINILNRDPTGEGQWSDEDDQDGPIDDEENDVSVATTTSAARAPNPNHVSSSINSIIPSGSNSTFNYLSSVLEEERAPSFCSTNPGNMDCDSIYTENTACTANTVSNSATSKKKTTKWSKPDQQLRFVDYFIPHGPQFGIILLILCIVYTAMFHDVSQRIGIVIFLVMTVCLMVVFRYFANIGSMDHEKIASSRGSEHSGTRSSYSYTVL